MVTEGDQGSSEIKIIEKESSETCQKHGIKQKIRMTDVMGSVKRWVYCVECSKEREAEREFAALKKQNSMVQSNINRNLKNSAIAPRFMDATLANWVATTPAQKEVVFEVQAFLEAPDLCTGLIFCGRPGTGKNHMACAIAKYFISNLNRSALITTVFKMVRSIKDSWKGNRGEEVTTIKVLVEVGLLVIDEIGVQFGSETEMLYLQEIINDRYEAQRPTILISNKTPEEISKFLGERIIDRFREGGHVLVFDWESYRGKKL